MPSFSSFNIANEQSCQQTRFVVTWQEGLYFASQEKQSLMYFFLLLCRPFFPLLQSVWKSHQRHQSLILQDCEQKISIRTDGKVSFCAKIEDDTFRVIFKTLCYWIYPRQNILLICVPFEFWRQATFCLDVLLKFSWKQIAWEYEVVDT